MNNFDDLFEQQPQPEATEKPEPQKEKPKKQWWQIREEKQRKEAYATLDRVFGAFSEGHGDMKAYLDTQSRFPFHSARNAILIGEQCPNAKRVGGYKEWASQGVEILEEEKRLPIIILEPGKAYRREDGSVGQNFYAKEVFDISQTTARDEAQPQVSYDDRLLLKALISNSPVPGTERHPGEKGHGRAGHLPLRLSGACQCPACPQQRRVFPRNRRLQSLCRQLYALPEVRRGSGRLQHLPAGRRASGARPQGGNPGSPHRYARHV